MEVRDRRATSSTAFLQDLDEGIVIYWAIFGVGSRSLGSLRIGVLIQGVPPLSLPDLFGRVIW